MPQVWLNRFLKIFRLNFGLIEKPDSDIYPTQNIPRSTIVLTVSKEDVNTIRLEGSTSNTPDTTVFDSVLNIVSCRLKNVKSIDVSVDNNGAY